MNLKKPTHIVLDSSVLAKWFFQHEADSASALKLREMFLKKELEISVPVLIYYEISNLLKTAVKSVRVDQELAVEAYKGFLSLDFTVYSSGKLMEMALQKSLKLDISTYDASYIALAEYLEVPLVTADQKLIDKVQSKFIQNLKTPWIMV